MRDLMNIVENGAAAPKKRNPLSVTEFEVLQRIVKGERAFGGHREIMACHKLAKRGWIEVEIQQGTAERTRSYNFGRTQKYDKVPYAGALVKAPKIEALLATPEGKQSILKALANANPKAGIAETAEEPTDAAERYVEAAEEAMKQFGEHIDLILLRKKATVVEIHEIAANPMRQGWGTKALTILAQLADQYGVTLTLEVGNDEGGWDDWSDDEDEDEVDEPSDEAEIDVPSDSDLVELYSRFGFEELPSLTTRIQMRRKPQQA